MEASTDSMGVFVIPGLPPGVYKLGIRKPGFLPKGLEVSVEAGKETPWGYLTIEVNPPPCIDKLKEPSVLEMKLPAGGKPRVSDRARCRSLPLPARTGMASSYLTM